MDFWFIVKEKILSNKSKILFVYPLFSSFVRTDYEILSERFDVVRYQYVHKKSILVHIVSQIKLFFWLTKNIFSAKAVYIWFADYHSFIPTLLAKLFRKKSFLVLGGYDVAYIPEYNYGSFNNPIRAFCAKQAISLASINLAVSDNIREDAIYRAPNSNVKILYTGYSSKKFVDTNEKRSGVLSVIGAESKQRLYIKGVDLIVKIAKLLPEINFKLVAVNESLFNEEFGVVPNITIIPQLEQSDLITLYQTAKIYLQTSLREGLPNSVCEAMLCGAIPVGVNAGGIPIAIGDCGFVSQNRDAKEMANLIIKAQKKELKFSDCGKRRINENFSLEMRKEKLLSTINDILNK